MEGVECSGSQPLPDVVGCEEVVVCTPEEQAALTPVPATPGQL